MLVWILLQTGKNCAIASFMRYNHVTGRYFRNY